MNKRQKVFEQFYITEAQNNYLSVLIMCLWKKEKFGKDKILNFLDCMKKFDHSYGEGNENIKVISDILEDQFNFSVFINGKGYTRKEVLQKSAEKAYIMISCLILNDVYDWTDARIKGFITAFKNSQKEYSNYNENKQTIRDHFDFIIK